MTLWFSCSLKEHMDFQSPVGPHMQLPYCHNNFEESKKTLSHLTVSKNLESSILLTSPYLWSLSNKSLIIGRLTQIHYTFT